MKICVFCGSRMGVREDWVEGTYQLGRFMGLQGMELIYGGAQVGLMGRLADGVLAVGGEVTGIIPDFLSTQEVARLDLTRLEVVGSMDERKRRMFELADLFVTLPGGFGTFDELFEVVTLRQLGLLKQSCLILNLQGYYSPLLAQLERMLADGFISADAFAMFRFVDSFADLQAEMLKKP